MERNERATRPFLGEIRDAYYLTMERFLRELSTTAPFTGATWQAAQDEAAASARLGFIDRHDSWDHPQNGWDPTCLFALQAASLRANTKDSGAKRLSIFRVRFPPTTGGRPADGRRRSVRRSGRE